MYITDLEQNYYSYEKATYISDGTAEGDLAEFVLLGRLKDIRTDTELFLESIRNGIQMYEVSSLLCEIKQIGRQGRTTPCFTLLRDKLVPVIAEIDEDPDGELIVSLYIDDAEHDLGFQTVWVGDVMNKVEAQDTYPEYFV